MKLIKMECPNCHAGLEIDIEHMQAYCPYCGTKLLFDLDQINHIIAEKEKTKRYKIKQESEVSKAKIQQIVDIFDSDGILILLAFIGIAAVIIAISFMN